EPNVEAGFERFQAITGGALLYDAFRDAVDACLREGLIREPIRLPEGALQCHWHLELTAAGAAAARRLLAGPHSTSPAGGLGREGGQARKWER
ncbi:MAG TPA: hypothetical protein VFW75_08265, partial [Acetobacteraceae bacterium]|nr:hypothetical protein [Acetobacteraceae bacterium]